MSYSLPSFSTCLLLLSSWLPLPSEQTLLAIKSNTHQVRRRKEIHIKLKEQTRKP
jgi:hypothetical protein